MVWALWASSDLNANPVRFEAECGVEKHLNDEVDVTLLVIAGSGLVKVDGEEHPESSVTMTFVPEGALRSTRSTSGDLVYFTVHSRRGPLRIGGCEPREFKIWRVFSLAQSRARQGEHTSGSTEVT